MERLGSPQLFQGSRGSSRPNSRPNSSGLSEFEAYARHVQREDGKARKESAYEADTANRATLQEWHGPLRKTGKQLGEHTATGGMYLKYKACRLMDNPSSKALNGENIDRIQLETAWSCPTVRTVLRITDDLHLDDQIRSSGSDDIVREIVGTASSSFMAAMAKIDELRDDVQVQRDERRVQAESNLSKVAYQSLYGLKQVQEPKQTVTHGRSRRRSSVGSALSSEVQLLPGTSLGRGMGPTVIRFTPALLAFVTNPRPQVLSVPARSPGSTGRPAETESPSV
ncbi:unnamed protein product [Durusdinium trenchii]|uniref:Uncharacterized protein n=1 Tax=Durusdinium trenchii TaxID=1381693 RepID=A0ABP0QP18_9DINO